ncbi:MAG: glyoxylate carboligase [Sphingobacteriales bacterium]
MDKIGGVEIRVAGKSGNLYLKPENYVIQEGAVRHVFKTPIKHIIGFSSILGQVQESKSIDFLDLKTTTAFESIQNIAQQNEF